VLGIVGRDGAHAEYLRLPATCLLPVPAAIADRHAVFVEPLAAACGILERCPQAATVRTAVIGDGKLGLLCAFALAAAGGRPLLIGKHARKLALADRRGIETALVADAARRGRDFDVVVECSGNASGFDLALALLVPQGTLVLKSTFHGTTPIDAARVVVEELHVVGSRCGRFTPALALLAAGTIAVDDLISEILPLERATHGLHVAAISDSLKILLTPA
jgi:threonine dehydrogenase-like Zn-dependent dehydrogenase